jgi:hypothetical protein
MADLDLQLRVRLRHDYMTSYAVQTTVDAKCERLRKKMREFRGDVVSRGFDIENVLSDIITHLLYINRPRYENETEDEYRFHRQCSGFIRNDLLGRSFGFGPKKALAGRLLKWIPKRQRQGIDLPDKLLDDAVRWRNSFAHDPIELAIAEDNSVIAILKERIHGKIIDQHLTDDQVKIVTDALEECYAACCALEGRLCTRYGDARPKPA